MPVSGIRSATELAEANAKVLAKNVDFYYGSSQALFEITMTVPERCVTALIGPSGCGKSTFLRCINRMNEMIPGASMQGEMRLDGADIYAQGMDVVELRKRMSLRRLKSSRQMF